MEKKIIVYEFAVKGMHCRSCELLIEDKLKKYPGLITVSASSSRQTLKISGKWPDTPSLLAEKFTEQLKEHGYFVSLTKEKTINKKELVVALGLAFIFLLFFYCLQKARIMDLVNLTKVDYGSAFIIGLIASVSSCLAVVGGLVLSLSANAARHARKWSWQLLFFAGRQGSFFILGGLLGAIGGALPIGRTGNLVLMIMVTVLMFVIGINLLDVFSFSKKLQFVLPKKIGEIPFKMQQISSTAAPLLAGAATFFLPCGFTQSMQLYTLTVGDFLKGALTMFSFAAGTLPMLFLLSSGAFSIVNKPWKGVFFKTIGFVVMSLAMFNLLNALALAGVISPLFNF